MERKIIEVKKHPYMWKVQVTFGTLEDMLKKQIQMAGMERYSSICRRYIQRKDE